MIKHLLEKLFLKRVIIWLLLIIMFILVAILKLSANFLHKFSDVTGLNASSLKNVNDELFTFLTPLILFGFIYQIFTEKENREIARRDIVDSIIGNEEVLALFSTTAKMDFVRKAMSSIFSDKYGDKKYGEMFYNNMVRKYLDGSFSYREDFKYDVEINNADSDFNFKGIKVLSKDQYYALEQTLIYTKHIKKELYNSTIKIIFAFDDVSLDYWMNETSVFFREVIEIEDWEKDIDNYTAEDFQEFVVKCLKLKIAFFENKNKLIPIELTYDVKFIKTDEVKGLEIVINDKNVLKNVIVQTKSNTYYTCRLSFTMPFHKKRTRFHFTLPEPTLKPKFSIRFDKNFKNKRIDYVTHFANTLEKEENKLVDNDYNRLKFELNNVEIIYPRSGIVFFWDS